MHCRDCRELIGIRINRIHRQSGNPSKSTEQVKSGREAPGSTIAPGNGLVRRDASVETRADTSYR